MIRVVSLVERIKCHVCQGEANKGHGTDEAITVRHLSVFGLKTYLKMRPKRFECPYCWNKPRTTQQSSWYKSKSPQTKVYEQQVLLQLVNSTVQDVAIKEKLGYGAVDTAQTIDLFGEPCPVNFQASEHDRLVELRHRRRLRAGLAEDLDQIGQVEGLLIAVLVRREPAVLDRPVEGRPGGEAPLGGLGDRDACHCPKWRPIVVRSHC